MASKLRHEDGLVSFRCPGCGWPHTIRIAPDDCFPGRPLWTWNGDDEKPTFHPSIRVTGGELQGVCHSFVKNGEIQFLNDCKHSLAGKTIPLPDWERKMED